MSQQQKEQQEQQGQQHQRQPLRATRKCCAFCAKRGERCDGLRPRCSVCIAAHKLVCRYRQKHPKKARSRATPTPHLRVPSDDMGQVGQAPLISGAGMIATLPGRGTSDVFGGISLKRCRLSPSSATGLVGMQENAFLNDYFECLGFLPLVSTSVVRQAVVELMLGSMPQQRRERRCFDTGMVKREDEEGECAHQALADHGRADDSSQCILWCSIALGALVQGCSLEFVGGYLQLARDSLAECFDSTTLPTARAYLVMSFLQTFLGDQETSQRYTSFANSIVERLPPDAVPSDMANMLLAEGSYDSRLFHHGYSCGGFGDEAKLEEESEGNIQIPAVKNCMHEGDLCNFYFIADRCMHKAFFQDTRTGGDFGNLQGEGKGQHKTGMEGQPGRLQEEGRLGRMKGVGDGEDAGLTVLSRSSKHIFDGVKPRGRRCIPQAGAATKKFIEDTFPNLTGHVTVMEGSGKCSGVAGLLFHGAMGYMKMIKGDTRGSFRSVEVCARVLTRFPGICRYRPHLTHCVLTAAASRMRRDVYDPVRDAYNSILPSNCTPAPPLEEWGGVKCICNDMYCRSLHVAPKDVDTASYSNERFARAKTDTSPKPSARLCSVHTPPVTGNICGMLRDPTCGAQPTTESAEEAWRAVAP